MPACAGIVTRLLGDGDRERNEAGPDVLEMVLGGAGRQVGAICRTGDGDLELLLWALNC